MLQYCRNIFLSSFLKNIISLIFHRTFNLKLMKEPESRICRASALEQQARARERQGQRCEEDWMKRPVDIRETKQSEVLVQSLPTLTCPLAHLTQVVPSGWEARHTRVALLGEDDLLVTFVLQKTFLSGDVAQWQNTYPSVLHPRA